MTREKAIVRLYQMLQTEQYFLQHCEEQKAEEDIIKYQRDGVKALRKALKVLKGERA